MKKIVKTLTYSTLLLLSIFGPEIMDAINPFICHNFGWTCIIPAYVFMIQLLKTLWPELLEEKRNS